MALMKLSFEEQSEIRSRLLVKWSLSAARTIATMRFIVRDGPYNTTTYQCQLIVDMKANKPIVGMYNRMYTDDVFNYLRDPNTVPSLYYTPDGIMQTNMIINYFEAVWTQYQQWLNK